jgi:hypothetical protein
LGALILHICFYSNFEFCVAFGLEECKMWKKVKMAKAIKLLPVGVRVACD